MINIEDATSSDAEQILQLQKGCYIKEADIYGDYSIPPLTQSLTSLKLDIEGYTILKAMENGKIIGSVRAFEENDKCNIRRLFVHPRHQNKGLGKMLMSEIETRFKSSSKYELFTGFRSVKNLAFYTNLGYKETHRKEFQPNLYLVFMEKVNS